MWLCLFLLGSWKQARLTFSLLSFLVTNFILCGSKLARGKEKNRFGLQITALNDFTQLSRDLICVVVTTFDLLSYSPGTHKVISLEEGVVLTL